MPDMPNVSKWVELYTAHGAPDGGITKALQAYWDSGANTPQKYLVQYTALEKALAAYISKVSKSKKKIKNYEKFEKTVLDKFLGPAHINRRDTQRAMAGIEQYKQEIMKFMSAVQQLKKGATAAELGRFKSGPARGLSAMASKVRNLTKEQVTHVNKIRDEVKKVDTIVDGMKATDGKKEWNGYVKQILAIAEEVRKLAKEAGFVK